MKVKMIALSILMGVSFSAAAGNMYQWKDKNGVVNFADRPPEGTTYTQKDRPTSSWEQQNVSSEQKDSKKATDTKDAKKQDETSSAEKEENCKAAKSAKATLLSGKRISVMDDKGELTYLDEAQIAKKLEYADKAINSWCGTEKK